jgi:integrase
MSLTVSFRVIRKTDIGVNNELPIQLRIRTPDGSSETTINTGSSIQLKYWKNGTVSTRCPNYTNISRNLTRIRQEIEEIIIGLEEEGKFPNPKLVKNLYEKTIDEREKQSLQPLSYEECWKKFLNKKKVETSRHTHIMYRMLYQRLNEFSKEQKVQLTFEYLVSSDFETDFKKWSWEIRKHKNSFVRKNLTSIKSFLNFCHQNNYINVKLRNYSKPKELEKVEVVYLTKEEVLKLYSFTKYDFSDGKIYPLGVVLIEDKNRLGKVRHFTNWEVTKDMFLFMCVIGCRWGDLHTLTWDSQNFDNETFVWENQKTKKYTTVPLDKIGIEVLKKYGKSKSRTMTIFPKYSQVKFNKTLKKICKELNLKRLVSVSKLMGSKTIDTEKKPLYEVVSSHSGRRSFIMNLLSKDVDYKTIMTMTGHSDVKSLMKYVSVNNERVELGRNIYSETGNSQSQLELLFGKLTEKDKERVLDYMKLLIR